jgi:hypothetical protein
MRERPKLPVEIKGLDETLKAMRKFEPDLAKNLNKEVRALLTPIQKTAQSYVPSTVSGLSNWMLSSSKKKITKETSSFNKGTFPKFNSSLVRRGIKIYIGRTKPNTSGFVSFYRITNTTAAGAIMETSGRVHPDGRQSTHTVMINKRFNPIALKVHSTKDSQSNNPDAGRHFVHSMPGELKGKGKMRGRLIYRAFEEDYGKTTARLVKAVEKTVAQFERRSQAQVFKDAA